MNQYDIGAEEDFNTMTEEIGTEIEVFIKKRELAHNTNETTGTKFLPGVLETAFLQELSEKHDVVLSGLFEIGDVRIIFQSDTVAEPECEVHKNGRIYKVINLTKTRGMNNDNIIDCKAFGKRLPKR